MDSAAARFRRARGAAFPKDDPFASFGGVVSSARHFNASGGRPQTTAVDVTAVDPTFNSPRRRALNPNARSPQGGLGAWPKDDALRPTTSEMRGAVCVLYTKEKQPMSPTLNLRLQCRSCAFSDRVSFESPCCS